MRRIVAILAVSAIALAGCGGSSGSKSDSNGNSDSFSKLFEQSRNATLKVTYSSTDENGTSGDEFTIAQDGPDKIAFMSGDSAVIVNGATATQCSSLQSEPTCTDYPGGVAAARTQITAATATLTAANSAITGDAESNGVGKSSTSQIAGRTAECVSITPGGIVGDLAKRLGGGSYESCLDKDTGVVLKWEVQGGKQAAGIIATKVEQPTAADFEVPAGATTATTELGSTDTTEGDSSTPTTTCTPLTIPGGGTIPGVPCMPS